ncbi:major facilitator superfamily protein [Sarocladium implicatum]|nr:major facilitator superfamily protein [Sarocladium implicatum]
MASHHRTSLPYDNPSLGQMASSATHPASPRREVARPAFTPIRKHPVQGARQAVLVVSLLAGLLFSSLDTSIVATSLVTISHDLNDFINAPWIVLSYLLTYMGFAVCISKLSDIYGRKNMLVVSWVVFVAFSLGCANASDMKALVICRAFQGIGASGLYSLTQIGLVEIGPSHRPSIIGAMIGATLAFAFILGPLIGGAVAHLATWRWLFNMNIPFGLVTILAITNLWPYEEVDNFWSWRAFTRIDFVGSATLICSSGLLVFALQQAGSQTFAWVSVPILMALAVSAVTWAGFVWWEVLLELKRIRKVEPIFPIRLMARRVYASGLMVTLLTGFPYIASSIVLPERFQIVNGQSVLQAGVHILPLLGGCAIGSFLGGAISSKANNTGFTLVGASALQLLGIGMMLTLPSESGPSAGHYGFQAIFGLGVGLSFSAATIMTNLVAGEESERASAQGAVAQARVLGGCIGLSICTIILNAQIQEHLGDGKVLSQSQLEDLLRSPLSGLRLPMEQRDLVKRVYANAFRDEVKVMTGVCAAMVLFSLFTLERNPAPLERMTVQLKNDQALRRGSDSGTELTDLGREDQGNSHWTRV